ncbi:MAG: FAD-dependent oxidoreductase [Leptolyngbya sp. SIO1E4]|nr:FAD-dependent oxidoreductase [Leptolyngbya sp. SIO1E4]
MQPLATVDPFHPKHTAFPPQVCVVGGGFGGLYTALYLHQRCRRARHPCHITLIEPRDHFVFTPLLYELLTDELKPWEIVPRYATLLQGTTIRHLQTAAKHLELSARRVELVSGERVSYDYLVVATGSRDRSLPIPGWAEYTYGFRTLADVERLSARLANLLAAASHPINMAIVGGGPNGVELACKLADCLGSQGTLHLIERGSVILKPFPARVQRAAVRSLAQRRVALHLETEVTAIEPNRLHIATTMGGDTLAADVVIGVAGTQPRAWLAASTSVNCDHNGAIMPRSTLQIPQHPEVFVVGDQAIVMGQGDRPAPQTAQAAYQGADTVAHNLLALMQRRPLKSFHYTHLGDMMTLGQQDALVDSAGIVLKGRVASILRQVAYVYRLPPGGNHRWRVARYRLARVWHWLWHWGS